MRDRHPLSAAFPDMDHEDFDDLVASIKAHGQREPITLYQDKILDGWHRYRACLRLGISPITTEFKGDDPVAFVIDLNLKRRHLTPSQKALAIVTCSTWQQSGRPKTVPRGTPGMTGMIVGIYRLRFRVVNPHNQDVRLGWTRIKRGNREQLRLIEQVRAREGLEPLQAKAEGL